MRSTCRISIGSFRLWPPAFGGATMPYSLTCFRPCSIHGRYGMTSRAIRLLDESGECTMSSPLASRWSELTPWPEATEIVRELASKTKIGVITNCSEELGVEAANKLGVKFDVVLTAERAGYYKPDPRVYETAIKEIDEAPERILYVAGSPYDVRGSAATGMPVYWHNRIGLVDIEASSKVIESSDTLKGLRNLII